ncbi:armadillo-type protein, partial [Haematococcus lacustris]
MEGSVSIDPAHVLSVIQGALSADNAMRCRAEQLLRTWEADAAPGFMASLLQIVQNSQAIDEPTRLLAAVIAKNAVGSSWRKTLGSREWCRVGEEEKEGVRQAAASCMMNDPSERVAVQLSLLIANIAQFDFPGRAPHLLEGLAAAAVWPADLGEPPPPGKLRALKALRRVLISLSTKRFVVEPARGPAGQSGIL